MKTTLQETMEALVLENYNASFQLRTLTRPVPAEGQVLVRINASGINPLDIKIKNGKADHAKQPLPAILGIDMAGIVEETGPGVTGFKPGDEVYGMTGGVGSLQGSLATFAAVDVDLLAIKPASLTMREAAAIPLTFITAWEGLVDRAHIHAGQKVLIHGGAGGIGQMAIQIALACGADVYATGSTASQEIILRTGAIPIDYTLTSVDEYVNQYTNGEGFDIILDTVGGDTLDASFTAVRPYHGHVVSALGWGTHSLASLSFRAASYSGIFTLLPLLTRKGRAHHGEILKEATRLAESGNLFPLLDARRFTMHTVQEAYAILESQKATGKLVVDIDE